MLSLLAALAATGAAQAATPPAAPAARTLKDIPGVTIKYYDVAGKNPRAIQKSIASQRPKGADGQPVTAGFNWNANTEVTKRTEGTTCTISAANVKFSATAELPRLVDEKALEPQELKSWNDYVAGLDAAAAMELGFYADRMGQVQAALVGKSCDAAPAALDAALAQLKAQEQQFVAAQVAAKAAATGQAKAAENSSKSKRDAWERRRPN